MRRTYKAERSGEGSKDHGVRWARRCAGSRWKARAGRAGKCSGGEQSVSPAASL